MRRALPLVLLALAGCGGGGRHGSSSPGSGVTFAANSIVYGVANGTDLDYAVDEVSPAGGTPTTVVADVDGAIFAFALDPSRARYALAADDGTGTYGVYLSKSLSLSGATRLVVPAYVAVGSLAVVADGTRVVYTAVTGDGTSHLFTVPASGGAPVDYGTADAAAVSPDGDTVLFTTPDSTQGTGGEALLRRSLAAGPSGASATVAASAGGLVLPAFSPDGTKLAYWTLGGSGNALTVAPLAGGTTVSIPGVGAFEPQGTAFGPDGTTLAIVGQSGSSGIIATAPADGSAAPTTIATSSTLLGNYGFFWTDANGRARAGARSAGFASRHRKRM